MNKHHIGTIADISRLTADVFKVTVKLDFVPEIKPGQFLNVKVPGFTLRRPFGISHFDAKAKTVSFCFQTRGEGTKALAKIKVGEKLDILLPLGNGFPNYPVACGATPSLVKGNFSRVMLIGGGIGVFPLLTAAKDSYAFLGFRNRESVVLEKDFRKVAKEVTIVTDGFVTDIAKANFDRIQPDAIFACGPHAMFRALKEINFPCPVYVSLEERMACGFGACICCTIKKLPSKIEGCTEGAGCLTARVCCEGPIFLLSEVII